MFDRYTENARRSIFFARHEAGATGSQFIELEHLVLGILRETPEIAGQVQDLDSLRKELTARFTLKDQVPGTVDLPLSHPARRALTHAADEASRLGHVRIDTPDLLLGVLHENDPLVAGALLRQGITKEMLAGIPQGPPVTRESLHQLVDQLPESAIPGIADMLRNVVERKGHAGWHGGTAG